MNSHVFLFGYLFNLEKKYSSSEYVPKVAYKLLDTYEKFEMMIFES
jgi:hypothetical protein